MNEQLTFAEAWNRCASIRSAVKHDEAEILFRYALKCPEDMPIVEIGSDRGRSTVLLANTGRKVIAIDPHLVATYSCPETGQSGSHTEDDYVTFRENIRQLPNVSHLKYFSKDLKDDHYFDHHKIGFMFIDGNHAWPHPKEDFLYFEKHFNPGVYIAWHDHGTFPGVTRAVDHLVGAQILERIESSSTMQITRLTNG